MNKLELLRDELKLLSSSERAASSAWYFKTGPGQYGEGDVFIGVSVPDLRKVAKDYETLSLDKLEQLLLSPIHEERLISLIILVIQFFKSNETKRKTIYNFYISHTDNINNWDLVDCSAANIVGAWLYNRDKKVLSRLSHSDVIWERRIAILATFYYIKRGDPTVTIHIARLLIHDQHDLIQKAVGWMLREIGKRCSQDVEENFLAIYYKTMPRTTLRYAIERFPKDRREQYLKGIV